ncbi:CYTH and CHAD domain-containing protein [Rothia halotolerans]|uniref:CYTH and CHAD domain-containing protein n=1 Tax=Rothia halotolerans TaxID=405770 RepID=UPI00101CCD5A|nr:CYTH and CHAD domain-containing protein [Rothia halotolerans]
MSKSQLEIEKKYEAPADGTAGPDLEDVPGLSVAEVQDQELDATYFDTEARDLLARKVALRRRRGGHDEGWHVKFSWNGARHEVHFPLLKDRTGMPRAVQSLVSGLTGEAPLVPLAHLATHRRRTLLEDERGEQVVEVCDDDVRALDHSTGRERAWREWEVELADAGLPAEVAEHAFSVLDEALRKAGAAESSSVAKIARALGEDRAFDEAADIPGEEYPTGGKPTAEDPSREKPAGKGSRDEAATPGGTGAPVANGAALVTALLRPHLEELPVLDLAVRADAPDAVHQLRIRMRSIRSILRGLRGSMPRSLSEGIVEGLRSAGLALGEERDLEVIRKEIERQSAWPGLTRAARRELEDLLEEEGRAAHRRAVAHLGSEEHRRVLEELTALVEEPRLRRSVADASPRKLGRRMVEELEGRVRRRREKARAAWRKAGAGEVGPEAVAALGLHVGAEEDAAPGRKVLRRLHDVRKAAKSLRYAAEALEATGVLSQKRAAKVDALRSEASATQSVLGRLMDAGAAQDWLEHAARTLQRRDADRLAVGILLGGMAGEHERRLEDGLRAVGA